MSHYTYPIDLMFSSGQQFEVTITDEAGTEVYRFSEGRGFTMALVYKTINPGEAFKWQDEWDMTNKDGEKLHQVTTRQTLRSWLNPNQIVKKLMTASLLQPLIYC